MVPVLKKTTGKARICVDLKRLNKADDDGDSAGARRRWVFMDDILIYGDTLEKHGLRVEKVMQQIETAGLKLNRKKCSIR